MSAREQTNQETIDYRIGKLEDVVAKHEAAMFGHGGIMTEIALLKVAIEQMTISVREQTKALADIRKVIYMAVGGFFVAQKVVDVVIPHLPHLLK